MKLLLLVHSEADVVHLATATQSILNSSITGIWVVFSPAISVDTSAAAAKLDGEISQLKTAERQAADRGDYEAAKGYKVQREGKELDRAKALRDAWKVVSAEDRKKRTEQIFGPMGAQIKAAGLDARFTAHSDHYDREQWVAMLNSLSGVWFKPFVPGGFIVAWPESVASSLKVVIEHSSPAGMSVKQMTESLEPSVFPEKAGNAVKARLPQVPLTSPRRAELEAMHHMSIRPIAKKLGIEATGKAEMIEAILKAEATPETVDAY